VPERDYNTVYLQTHYITPPVTSRGIPELLNHRARVPFGRGRGLLGVSFYTTAAAAAAAIIIIIIIIIIIDY